MPVLDASLIRPRRAGAGQPLVLLHGLDETGRIWDGLPGLADRFATLTCDLPGFGETPEPDHDFEIEDLADQLAAVMTGSGMDRAHVIGTSLGGMVAQCFAAAWPARVDRLVLCDTSPGLSDGARDALTMLPGLRRAHAAMARADLMDLAEEIFNPTLILCAEGADLAMRDGADFLARSIPRGELAFVPGATSHAVIERPDWVTRVVLDFLGR